MRHSYDGVNSSTNSLYLKSASETVSRAIIRNYTNSGAVDNSICLVFLVSCCIFKFVLLTWTNEINKNVNVVLVFR